MVRRCAWLAAGSAATVEAALHVPGPRRPCRGGDGADRTGEVPAQPDAHALLLDLDLREAVLAEEVGEPPDLSLVHGVPQARSM